MNIPKGTGDYSVNLTIGQMHAFLRGNGAKFANDTAEDIIPQIENYRDAFHQDFTATATGARRYPEFLRVSGEVAVQGGNDMSETTFDLSGKPRKGGVSREYFEECKRLRAINAELLEALNKVLARIQTSIHRTYLHEAEGIAQAAIAKAEGAA